MLCPKTTSTHLCGVAYATYEESAFLWRLAHVNDCQNPSGSTARAAPGQPPFMEEWFQELAKNLTWRKRWPQQVS